MKDLIGKGKPFYSALDLGAKALKRKVGTGSEFLKELMALPGVKPTELKERNLEGLMNAPRMTHEEFLTHLAAKPAPAIREKILNNPTADDVEKAVRKKLEKTEAEELKSQGYSKKEIEQELEGYANNIKRNRPTIWDQIWRNTYSDLNQNPTAHDQYTLPGGERYREMLIKAPKGGDEFPGVHAHFGGEKNILASMRLKDRTGPNGEKLLHLEELQSDWHQQGRDKGYIDPNAEQKLQQIEKLKSAFEELQTRRRQLHEQAKQEPDAGPRFDSLMEEANSITPKLLELNSQMHNLEHFGRQQKDAVPDAPFKKNWEEMALKRLMHHAAEKGYHGLVVTPGDVQADRYSLAKHIDSLSYEKKGDKYHLRYVPKGGGTFESLAAGIAPEDLASHVGKEMAEKIMNKEGNRAGSTGIYTFPNVDLQVGGEGMKGFYDKKVPNILNAIGKKYGIKTHLHGQPLHDIPELPEEHEPEDVESHRKMAATPLHHFPITEPMRQDILKNGLPLYKEGGMIHKAIGGTVQPSVNQMRTALMENKFAVPAADLKSVGAQEAPQLDTKVYVNEGGQDGMGGVDMNAMQPGMQLMQAQPNLDPTKNQPQQGGQPSSAGASSPAQQPPSNILQMTRQGQAMNAMTPPQQPQGMKDGGDVKPQLSHEMYMQLLKRHLAGERLSKAENELLGLYHRVGGGKKLKKPIGEYSFTTAPNPKVKMAEEKLVTPEDLVGGYGIPFIGDSSMAGRLLTGAEGHEFHQPVELEGGHDYMRANQHEDPAKRAIWASAQGKISHLTKKAKRVSEHGEPVYGIHTSMSPTGVDFSHMPVEVLAELVKNAKITKKAQNTFNKEMRAQHPEFPGVMHEELHDMLRAPGSGELRKHFVERMATDPYQEAGFPEIAMARLAVQHPNLMRHDEPGKEFVASSIGRFRPDFGQVETPVHPHHSYPSVIGGEYVGALHPEHAQPLMTTKEFFPEFHKQRREFNAPEAGDRRAFELSQPVQKFDQEWLDKVMPVYLKRRKKILGYKKGSKVTDNLDTMRLALTKNSKKAK